MQLQTITNVSREFNVSTRTLRYYEQIGLLHSSRQPGYAYRVYDEEALRRLRQILVLRKLRVPLKTINDILQNSDARLAVEVFQQNIAEINGEITALSTIRAVLHAFVERLNRSLPAPLAPDALDDAELLRVVEALSLTKLPFKEERNMQELNKASDSLGKLKDVRIVYLPPSTVASVHVMGENPEPQVTKLLDDFILAVNLPGIKPDFRRYGFNCPATHSIPAAGYEQFVTIPGGMEVPAPLVKKQFLGGLYAAHMIPMGAFHEWQYLAEWVQNSPNYEGDFEPPRHTPYDPAIYPDPCLEEVLDAMHQLPGGQGGELQLDLLLPIKQRARE